MQFPTVIPLTHTLSVNTYRLVDLITILLKTLAHLKDFTESRLNPLHSAHHLHHLHNLADDAINITLYITVSFSLTS